MKQLLAKILLAPILVAQGIYVRRTIVRLPEAAGPRTGITGFGPVLKLLILGDSAAAGVGVSSQEDALAGQVVRQLSNDFEIHWTLFARTGETTESVSVGLQQSDLADFDVVLISLGVNDSTAGNSRQTFVKQTKALIGQIKSQLGATQIIFSSLPPMGSFPALPHPLRWFLGLQSSDLDNALIRLTEKHDCHYLDLDLTPDPALIAEDGFHPGAEVYAIWGQRAAALIKQIYLPAHS